MTVEELKTQGNDAFRKVCLLFRRQRWWCRV